MTTVNAETLEAFLGRIPDLKTASTATLVAYFVYFLTVEQHLDGALPRAVEDCFLASELPHRRVRQILSERSRSSRARPALFVRGAGGYRLTRLERIRLEEELHGGPSREVSRSLRALEGVLSETGERNFLSEAIRCYEVQAYRASIMMVWLLTVSHLYQYVLRKRLGEFNSALANVSDKRVRTTKIESVDDFSDIPEGKFIELCRSARIINNDVRKILDVKLGIRNSYAHPSGVSLSPMKANEFIVDLVTNVVQKLEY